MGPRTTVVDLSVREVFNNAQFSTRNHQTLAKTLIQKYNDEGETFCQEFLQCLKIILVQDEKSPVVERSVDFVATFCAAMNDDGEEEMNDLLKIVFNFMLEHHEAKNQAVRYRICQMIDKIMNRLGQAELDVNICEKITECMLQRLLDKVSSVRAEAVKALYRLQEPEDQDCPIIRAFLFHMGRDPSADVRTNVVRIIALNQVTVPHIIKRILDIRETVRCAAYKTLSRINLRSFSIGQRELLLNQGLRDRFDKVKACVVKELLNTWFTSTNKNFIEFLTVLDVETSTETCTLALNVLFEHQPLTDVISGVPVDSVTHLIPHDKLNPAVSFYWRSVAVHLHNNAAEDLEKIVPELTHYCSYIASLMKSKERDQWEDHEKEFILKQLLEIIPVFDLSDEAGRANLRQLLLDLLLNDDVQVPLVPVIVSLLCSAIPDTFIRLQTLAEIVSEMHEPLTVVCSEMSVEEKRKIEIKRAELCVKLYEQREIQEEAIKRQDFMEAEAMKPEIQALEKRIAELTSQPDVPTQEVRQVKNDPFTLTKCLTIVSEMMQSPDVTGLTPQLRSLLDNFVLNNLEVPDVEVLNARIRTLALYSLWDVELAKKYMNLFMFYFNLEVQENEEIYLTVIKAIFDLFVVHGINTFQVDTEIADVRLKTVKRGAFKTNTSVLDSTSILDTTAAAVSSGDFIIGNESCRSLLSKLCSLLNSTVGEVRRVIAEGLCKLLLTGRIASSRILTHLLLVWFNPVTEHDPAVRQMLGCFLEMFTSHVPEAAELLEEAFLPVLKVILDAPEDSPLAEVDENEVVSLLINIMKSKGQANVHNSLAVRLCTEILKHPENYYNKVYLKTLVNLSLSLNDVLREDLKNLAEQMHKVVLEKSLINYVKKFEQILERGPDSQSKLTGGEVNGNMEHPQGNDLLSLSGGSDGEMSEEEGKTLKKTKRTADATTNRKKKTRKTQSSPLEIAIRDARRALSLDSEDGDFIAERELDSECNLPVVHEELLTENQNIISPEVISPQVAEENVVADHPEGGNETETSKKSKTLSKKNVSQQQQKKTLESNLSDVNGQKVTGRETRASKLKSLETPTAPVTKPQRGRGRKAAANSRSVAMMSVPRKVRTKNTVCEQTPQQEPPSPNPDESIAKSRPRRNVKVSVLQTFDDSTDESLATPDSDKKNVVISETSDSEFSCSDGDDDASDSDEFTMQKTTRSKKHSKVDREVQKVQEKFKKLGK
ncbi:condensin complex subunit 3 [Schistocerca nitens]|uniref:condensin complex subunit 3 n=1 Tax=Schistocerca nitens TaxID=7011 RepID=UPI002118E486|nr:condensin complex subunit 3 [Schistocerca nitens]